VKRWLAMALVERALTVAEQAPANDDCRISVPMDEGVAAWGIGGGAPLHTPTQSLPLAAAAVPEATGPNWCDYAARAPAGIDGGMR
jgi:hypothetical protein